VSFDEYERRESRIGNGAGSDYSVAQVLRRDNGHQVAEIRYRADVDEFADDLARLGRLYNDAIIAIERNGPGTAVLTQLKNTMGYPHASGGRIIRLV
jgi:phage terminase large subunit-like protein